MIARLKRALRDALAARGYVVRPTSFFGVSLTADLLRLLRNPSQPAIIDVGANAGQWLLAIKRTFPHARVLSYEPDPRAFGELQRNAERFADVECIQSALGAAPGRSPLFRNTDSVTSSLLPVTPAPDTPYADKLQPLDAIEIEVRTLSDEIARRGIAHVDLLKTDCQGFDLRVLEGAAKEIEAGKIDLIITEAMFQQEYDGQIWFDEIVPWLRLRNFSLIGLYDTLHDPRGRLLFADALFARNS